MIYTCKGSVRGECGHRHRKLETAVRCNARDSRGCKRQGGYSDRQIVRADGVSLKESEIDLIAYLENR
jgi:hypothetical protein